MFFKINLRIVVIFVFFLLAVFTVNASDVNFNFYSENYKSFETVQVNVTIENISLTRDLEVSNLVLLRGDNSAVSLAKSKVKVSNDFYVFYFDLPSVEPGNYRLSLKDVSYIKDGTIRIGSFYTNLTVVDGNLDIISVRPAFVLSKILSGQEAPFSLVVSNKGINTVNVNLQKDGDFFSIQTTNFNLAPGATKTISIRTSLFNKYAASFNGSVDVNYGSNSYNIPFIVFMTDYAVPVGNGSVNETNVSDGNATIVNVSQGGLYLTTLADRRLDNLSINLDIGEYYPSGQIVVKNGGVDLHNVIYSVSGNIIGMIELQPSNVEVINANSSHIFLLGINNSYNFTPGNYSGFLNVNSSESISLSVPVYINVFGASAGNYTNITQPFNISSNVSNDTYNYSNYTIPPKGRSKSGWIILLIVVLLLIILIYIYYKKTKEKKDEFEGFVEKVKSRRNY